MTSVHLALARFARGSLLLGLVAASGCGRGSSPAASITVLAASSLTDAFAELERDFEARNPGLDVVVSTAGSQALRVQIEHGAPADVFASANAEHMEAVVSAGLVSGDHPFARGGLTMVVPRGDPAGIESLERLPHARRVVLGTPEVPVGRYARAMLDRAAAAYGDDFRARVEARVVSLEPNVRLVLSKVELGEADAAIVYRSDVTAARAVEAIEVPPELDVAAEYHVGILARSAHPREAQRWVEHLDSAEGRSILSTHGFRDVDEP